MVDRLYRGNMGKAAHRYRISCNALVGLSLFVLVHHYVKIRNFGYTLYQNDASPQYQRSKVATDPCLEEKERFHNSIVGDSMDMTNFTCLKREPNKSGVFSYIVPQNFFSVTCKTPEITFAEKEMPPIALSSYPGSGNTWYRHLIEYISGIATSAKQCGLPEERATFIGECGVNESHAIVIKTHFPPKPKFVKAILILRNPFDVLLAQYNMIKSLNKTRYASPETFQTSEWPMFVRARSGYWLKHAFDWMTKFHGTIQVSFYEDMISDFYRELHRLCKFLGVKPTFKDLWCTRLNSEGNFHRHKPDWMSVSSIYTGESKKILQLMIEKLHQLFRNSPVRIPF